MTDENANVKAALHQIRLELDGRGLALKVCASKAGVSYSTFVSWFPANGDGQVPCIAYLPALAKALPLDLFNLLLPDGFHVVPSPEGVDYDEFARGCREYLAAKDEAHGLESPAGRDLAPCEKGALDTKIVQIGGGAK